MPTVDDEKQTELGRRGRPTKASTTELGTFIQKRLDAIGITRVEIAKQLQVSPSTIGRLLNGDTKVVQRVSAEDLSKVLRLNDMQRGEFLKLVGVIGAGTFALPIGGGGQQTAKDQIDLDMANDYAEALQHLLEHGQSRAPYVMEKAQHWYDKLTQIASSSKKDERIGATQVQFGLLLGRAQEAALPWYKRGNIAIQTYNHIENTVIVKFGLHTFQHDYTRLIERRAGLLREVGRFEESSFQYEYGISWVRSLEDHKLRSSLFRHYAHVKANQGEADPWARRIEDAQRDAQRINSPYRDEYYGLIHYNMGEGYKRLAFDTRHEIPVSIRASYAQKALDCFALSREALKLDSVAHYLVGQVSVAQCLIWIDPDEAIRQAQQIRDLAIQFYPSLLMKIDHTIYLAKLRRQARKHDPPLLLNLDAKIPY
jgi:transcriptional regulator with XRE-family HTH domain